MLEPTLRVQLLGDFLITRGDTLFAFANSPRLQSLFAFLVLHFNAPQARNHLAFTLWPDTPESNARNNLRQLLYELRRTLPDADQFLLIDNATIQWRSESPFTLDVVDFQKALTEAKLAAQTNDRARQHVALGRAIELYRGDLLPTCYDDWIVPDRERLRQDFITALEALVEWQEQRHDYRNAIATAQRLLQSDPLRESIYRRLMRLYASSGDRASALRTFHACATTLQRELAVDPSADTRDEYARLLQLDTPSAPAPPTLPVMPQLVGRQREWTQLQAAWRDAADGRPQMIVLQGEAGIGKTRLAEELIVWAHRQSIVNASAHCYAAEGAPPFAPIVTWLRALAVPQLEQVWMREITRLLPELATAHPEWHNTPLTEEWQRQRLFEALVRALFASGQPLLLFLDDFQWCDGETLACLRYLLRFDPQARVLIVSTCRSDELNETHPLSAFFLALRQTGQLTMLDLPPLDEHETMTLAGNVLGREIESGLAAQLYRETEGNPLFVVEVVRAWSSASRVLPPKVQAAIDARLAQISATTRELADVAAVIGRDFALEVLAKASGMPEDGLVRGIDELWRRRIVREEGGLTYAFTHDKLRQAIIASHSTLRSRVLHRRVAEAMEAVHRHDLEPVSAEIARHYEHALVPDKAIHYLTIAADRARATFSNAEAITLYRSAIEQVNQARGETHPRNTGRGPAASLRESLGDILRLIGHSEEARTVFEEALTFTQEPLIKARLYRRIGMTWDAQRRPNEALEEYAKAEAALGDVQEIVEWKQEWLEIQSGRMLASYWLGDFRMSQRLVQETEPVLLQYGTPLQRARFFHSLGTTAFRRDRYVISEETLGYLHQSVTASEESGNQSQICFCVFTLGYAYMWQREWDRAEKCLQDALKLAERIQDAERRVLTLTYLTVVYRARREMDNFQAYLARAHQAAADAKMLLYVAMGDMQEAWLAWRKRDLSGAKSKAYAALEDMRKLPVPFPLEWLARLPLLAIHSAQRQEAQAIDHARAMLVPPCGRFPPALENALQHAVSTWDASELEITRAHLERTIQLAEEMGYL